METLDKLITVFNELHAIQVNITVTTVRTFLYVANNEGTTPLDISQNTNISYMTINKQLITLLGNRENTPLESDPLLRMEKKGKQRHLFLTERGKNLISTIENIMNE